MLQERDVEGGIVIHGFQDQQADVCMLTHVTKFWTASLMDHGLPSCLAKLYYTFNHPVGDDVILSMDEFDTWDLEVMVEAAEFNNM